MDYWITELWIISNGLLYILQMFTTQGLDIIHLLTQTGSILRIELMSWTNDTGYAQYSNFSVGDESSAYRMEVLGFSGNVSYDAFSFVDGHTFSTYDNDNDVSGDNFAVKFEGGWWWNTGCSQSNLNGPYVQDIGVFNQQSMHWFHFYSGKGPVPLMRSRMMVTHPGVSLGQ